MLTSTIHQQNLTILQLVESIEHLQSKMNYMVQLNRRKIACLGYSLGLWLFIRMVWSLIKYSRKEESCSCDAKIKELQKEIEDLKKMIAVVKREENTSPYVKEEKELKVKVEETVKVKVEDGQGNWNVVKRPRRKSKR